MENLKSLLLIQWQKKPSGEVERRLYRTLKDEFLEVDYFYSGVYMCFQYTFRQEMDIHEARKWIRQKFSHLMLNKVRLEVISIPSNIYTLKGYLNYIRELKEETRTKNSPVLIFTSSGMTIKNI